MTDLPAWIKRESEAIVRHVRMYWRGAWVPSVEKLIREQAIKSLTEMHERGLKVVSDA